MSIELRKFLEWSIRAGAWVRKEDENRLKELLNKEDEDDK